MNPPIPITNIKPHGGRVLVKFTERDQERLSAGGIIIQESKRSKLLQALVVAVADDVQGITPGSVVYVHHNEGFDIMTQDGKFMRFVPSTGIYGSLLPETAQPAENGAD